MVTIMNKTIAIDGPAGSGKSSIAKLFASSIDFFYLDTGSLYRAVSFYLKQKGIASTSASEIEAEFKNIKITFGDNNEVHLNGDDVSDKIRTKEITNLVVNYAQVPEIRDFIRILQKNFAAQKNTVIDGRDIGTVVFPDAFCKFYLDANVDVRAKRRFNEFKDSQDITLEEVKEEIVRRDYLDRSRKQSPLKIATDAIVIDTSDLTIDEVLNTMISSYNKQLQLSSPEEQGSIGMGSNPDFLKILNEFDTPSNLQNQFVEATVISVGSTVLVDIGAKQEAFISRDEVSQLHPVPQVGEKINVVVVGRTPEGTVVSRKRAEQAKSYTQLEDAKNNNTPVTGKVIRVVKGGFIVDIMSNNAFCPMSEYDVRKVNHNEQVDKVEQFVILEHSLEKLVVSRKRIIEKELKENRNRFFASVEEGQVVSGKVVALLNYGIFVEIEPGVDIMVRSRDISWKRFIHPNEVVEYGQEVSVKIILIDFQNQKLMGSRKELEENPFDMFLTVHKVGDVVKGTVRKIQDYGAFVEITDGLSGLLKISDLDWLRRIEHPREVLSKNQQLNVKIIKIDKTNRRIDLGLKQLEENPWNSISKDYPIHSQVNAKVVNISGNGIYALVDEKIDAFLHIDDSNLTNEEEKDLTKLYNPGDMIESRVLRINSAKHRLELGLYKSTGDAWKNIEANYGKNDPIYGEVVEYVENGVNVKISEEVVGFCHITQVSEDETKEIDLKEHLEIGKQYPFLIQSINPEKKDLKLTRRDYLLTQKKKDAKSYINSSESDSQITISDLLK